MSKTFLTVVNSAILESGANLEQFASDGSDFTSTLHDSLMYKFKTWVNRAWQTVQQEAYDWEWMSEQAEVNLNPGIMFYSPHIIDWSYNQANPLTIYDTDGTIRVSDNTATKLVSLTGEYTTTNNFGYINLEATGTTPLSFGMKSGGEYFTVATNSSINIVMETNSSFPSVMTNGQYFNSVTIYCSDNDYIETTSVTFALSGVVVGVVVSEDETHTACAVRYSEFDSTFWDSLLTSLASQVNVELHFTNPAGDLANFNLKGTIESQSSDYTRYATVSPDEYTATFNSLSLNVTGGNITIPVDYSTVSGTFNFTNYQLNISGTIISAVDNVTATILIRDSGSLEVGYIFSQLLRNAAILEDLIFTTVDAHTVDIDFSGAQAGDFLTVVVPIPEFFKNYIHSWKSYIWSEELDDDDFVESVAEIDQQSFRLISHETPAVTPEIKLQYVPWDTFRSRLDDSAIIPGQPLYITEDNTGRWRFYPALDKPYTLIFDYVRNPQSLVAFDDVFKGIPDDFIDAIMWRALMYYGEYDEQPSVAQRSTRNYKDMLFRLEMRFREKFHLLPARLY